MADGGDSTRQWRAYVKGGVTFERALRAALAGYWNMLREMGPDLTPEQWREAEIALLDAWERNVRVVVEGAGRESVRRLHMKEDAFHVTNRYTADWLLMHGSELITEVTQQTKEGVRAAVRAALEDEEAPRVQARVIREMVGLRSDQVESLRRFADALPDDMPEERRRAAVARESRRKLNHRARLIARTETMRAANAGIKASWKDAHSRGFLPTGLMLKEWIAGTDTDRVCDECLSLAGQKRPLDEPFETAEGDEIQEPPLHPACRCTMGLVLAPDEEED